MQFCFCCLELPSKCDNFWHYELFLLLMEACFVSSRCNKHGNADNKINKVYKLSCTPNLPQPSASELQHNITQLQIIFYYTNNKGVIKYFVVIFTIYSTKNLSTWNLSTKNFIDKQF